KLDGYRAVAVINDGAVELWSRNHKSLTADYPGIGAGAAGLRCSNAVLDGEIVALDQQGRTRFQLLQGRGLAGASAPIVYYVFDLQRLASLHAEFQKRRAAACPFANLPLGHKSHFGATMNSAAMREVAWIKPELVAQVRFAEWTQEGLLRQPVFLGLRHDKAAK